MTPEKLRELLAGAILDAPSGRVTVLVGATFSALRDAGLAIVPREPTEAMQVAGSMPADNPPPWNGTDVRPVTARVYRIMVAVGDLLGERGE